jgi:hypothetical protein
MAGVFTVPLQAYIACSCITDMMAKRRWIQFGIWHLLSDMTGAQLTDLSLVWKDVEPRHLAMTFRALPTAAGDGNGDVDGDSKGSSAICRVRLEDDALFRVPGV